VGEHVIGDVAPGIIIGRPNILPLTPPLTVAMDDDGIATVVATVLATVVAIIGIIARESLLGGGWLRVVGGGLRAAEGVVVVVVLEVGEVGADLDCCCCCCCCCLVEVASERREFMPMLWLLLAPLPDPVIELVVIDFVVIVREGESE